MSEIQSHTKALEEKIGELESKLAELKKQLKMEIQAEQHKAIDQLDICCTDLDTTYNSLKQFMNILRDDFKKTFR